jgi:hypothetical protein
MHLHRRTQMSLARRTACVLSALLVVIAPLALTAPGGSAQASGPHHGVRGSAQQVAIDWQRIAMRTVYAETTPTPPPPVGVVYIAFTSMAVHNAVKAVHRLRTPSARAAIAQAAHDVLVEYFPGSSANLDRDLTATLDTVRNGRAKGQGVRIGAAAADAMIASRADDGRNDPTVVYSKPLLPGYWQPPAGGAMAFAWLARMDQIVPTAPVAVNGPDALTSTEYARDYNEVRRVGSVASTERTAEQTAIATFMAANQIPVYRDALCRVLEEEPLSLYRTTLLFARIDAAVVNAFIQTWGLKLDVGFWRPFQAIAGADKDKNPGTEVEANWASLVPNPSYSDYTSGHAAATSPMAEVVRRTLGEHTALTLRLVTPTGTLVRHYDTLSALEYDAFHARIWGGLHFRDAMEDGYYIGHKTARRVMRVLW